jgi:hypothetical protein
MHLLSGSSCQICFLTWELIRNGIDVWLDVVS